MVSLCLASLLSDQAFTNLLIDAVLDGPLSSALPTVTTWIQPYPAVFDGLMLSVSVHFRCVLQVFFSFILIFEMLNSCHNLLKIDCDHGLDLLSL